MSLTSSMTLPTNPDGVEAKLIMSGIHVELTEALKNRIREKIGRVLRHDPRIVRVRVDLEHDKTRGSQHHFVAKGQIQIYGPDILASAEDEDAYKALDLLTDKLDDALRRRHSHAKEKRHHPHSVELGVPLPKAAT